MYKLFPGLLASPGSWLLERLLALDLGGDLDLLCLFGGGVMDREVYLTSFKGDIPSFPWGRESSE